MGAMGGIVRSGRLLIGLTLLLAGNAPLQAQDSSPEAGQAAPDFTLKDLTGSPVRLSDLIGHPVLINFWASWCIPCRTEMPAIISALEAHRQEGLVVLAVNLRDQERSKDVRGFVAEFSLPFPVLLDERGRVRQQYALTAVPTTVFVAAGGVISAIHPGPMTEADLARNLAGVLPAKVTDTVSPP